MMKNKSILMQHLKIACLNPFTMDNFNQVFTISKVNEIWFKLHELHDDTSNVCEKKDYLAKQSYDPFQMK